MVQATYPEVVAARALFRTLNPKSLTPGPLLGAGSPLNASLFGLALRGVYLATRVTTRAGALLL